MCYEPVLLFQIRNVRGRKLQALSAAFHEVRVREVTLGYGKEFTISRSEWEAASLA